MILLSGCCGADSAPDDVNRATAALASQAFGRLAWSPLLVHGKRRGTGGRRWRGGCGDVWGGGKQQG